MVSRRPVTAEILSQFWANSSLISKTKTTQVGRIKETFSRILSNRFNNSDSSFQDRLIELEGVFEVAIFRIHVQFTCAVPYFEFTSRSRVLYRISKYSVVVPFFNIRLFSELTELKDTRIKYFRLRKCEFNFQM